MSTLHYKLATFEERSFTFKDGKVAYATADEARAAAQYDGKYRVSEVYNGKRTDFEPFEVTGRGPAPKAAKPAKGGVRRPDSWNTLYKG